MISVGGWADDYTLKDIGHLTPAACVAQKGLCYGRSSWEQALCNRAQRAAAEPRAAEDKICMSRLCMGVN